MFFKRGNNVVIVCKFTLRSLKMIFQMICDLKEFLKSEEEREGEKRVQIAWQNLSDEEVLEQKKTIKKIRKMIDDVENYIDLNRQAPPVIIIDFYENKEER
jgi:glucosamine 6-phosphate synthetase-like amidotransferase/phosphosugar isomerase protein